MSRLVVLDFDGTMTNAEAEGVPFRRGYLEDVATLTGKPVPDILALAERFEQEVADAPDAYGWMFNGKIVAPATVDPYLRIMPVARKIFDHVGAFPREIDRSRLLDGILYKYNYQKTVVAFRPDARDFLLWLGKQNGLQTYVVTNSHTEPVRQKIARLGMLKDGQTTPSSLNDGSTPDMSPANPLHWLLDRVHGRAQKYVIDEAFQGVAESMHLPGLSRPVLLRRRHYVEALTDLLNRHTLGWADLTVVGDIFELDLSLPLSLGASVVLVTNAHTPAYERAFVQAHPRGFLADELGQARAFLTAGGKVSTAVGPGGEGG